MRAIQGRDSHLPNLAFDVSAGLNFQADLLFARALGGSMTPARSLNGDALEAGAASSTGADTPTTDRLGNDMFLPDPGAARTFAHPTAIVSPGPHALIDTVPGDTSTTAVLTVGASPIVSAIDTIADNDFYKIELIAGHEYQIGMFGYTPSGPTDPIGPTGTPLLDSFIELYDPAGNLITSADGGADTATNSANSGFDALLTFTATTSGTYYVDARAFDNIPVDGDRGDMVGDYGLYAKDVTDDNSVYTPYYDANSPLYAIDWGTRVNKVDQTAANPDGNEGPRDTGNAQGTPTYGSALDMNALLAANGKTLADIAGKNVITIYFAKAGEIITSLEDPTTPGLPPAAIETSDVSDFEHNAVMTALHQFEKVADVVYLEVQSNDQADFEYASYQGTPGPGISLLGSMEPPDEPNEGLALFNSGDYRWNATDLQQGGFSFVTLIHEIGHGHGLAHPHDNGGHSGIMHGVEPEGAGVADYTTGDFDLNQGVFTMMSYEDGWQTSPYGNAPTTGGYGYLGGLMAFDIAAIQDKYGVNEDTATGNDVYELKDVNAPGTFYTSIWDAGGTDSIVYSGARDANIDLRPATLQYEEGGGGWVSYAYGIFGGFTIANGVTIENAAGGAGNDVLIGNDVANYLAGGAGNDSLVGGGGNDLMVGGDGNDYFQGGSGGDGMYGGAGNDIYTFSDSGDYAIEATGEGYDIVYSAVTYSMTPGSEIELLSAIDNNGTNALDFYGSDAANQIWGNAGVNYLYGGGGNDALIGFGGNDTLDGAAGADYLDGGAGADALFGGDGDDLVIGRDGNDVINGGTGADGMYGGIGDDIYFVDNASDYAIETAGEGSDIVFTTVSYGLTAGSEVEILSAVDNNGAGAMDLYGNELANQLWGNNGVNYLNGGAGNDALIAFGGNDTLAGGAGSDYLDGGAGSDNFVFDAALGATNVDTITGFTAGTDKIALDDAVFAQLTAGGLNPNAFFAGTAAHDADDRIIYDQATGNLYYDADGNGAGAQVLFANLLSNPTLSAADFQVI